MSLLTSTNRVLLTVNCVFVAYPLSQVKYELFHRCRDVHECHNQNLVTLQQRRQIQWNHVDLAQILLPFVSIVLSIFPLWKISIEINEFVCCVRKRFRRDSCHLLFLLFSIEETVSMSVWVTKNKSHNVIHCRNVYFTDRNVWEYICIAFYYYYSSPRFFFSTFP